MAAVLGVSMIVSSTAIGKCGVPLAAVPAARTPVMSTASPASRVVAVVAGIKLVVPAPTPTSKVPPLLARSSEHSSVTATRKSPVLALNNSIATSAVPKPCNPPARWVAAIGETTPEPSLPTLSATDTRALASALLPTAVLTSSPVLISA